MTSERQQKKAASGISDKIHLMCSTSTPLPISLNIPTRTITPIQIEMTISQGFICNTRIGVIELNRALVKK